METQYYIDGSGFIQGPQYGGQYHVSNSHIYGPGNQMLFRIDGSGNICDSHGNMVGFAVRSGKIWGPSNDLSWLVQAA
jgi:hypothetical protein